MPTLTTAAATTTVTREFPNDYIGMIHQDGSETGPEKGMTVIIHTRPGEQTPCGAEVFGDTYHAMIGLWWEGRDLYDYDGAFSLPSQVSSVLREMGFSVSEDYDA
jgi:hypothetical protein